MNTLLFGDKNNSEILPFTVEFSDRLITGESISEAQIDVQVFSGTDPDPSAMIGTTPVPTVNADGSSISFSILGGVAGAIYLIIVSALIDSGNLYIKVGRLAVVSFDPFASN